MFTPSLGHIPAPQASRPTPPALFGLYDCEPATPKTRHPEETDFLYYMSPNNLTREGWFMTPLTEEEHQESRAADKNTLQSLHYKWNRRGDVTLQKNKGDAMLAAMSDGTLCLKRAQYPVMTVKHAMPLKQGTLFQLLEKELGKGAVNLDRVADPIVDHVPSSCCSQKINEEFFPSNRLEEFYLPFAHSDYEPNLKLECTFHPPRTVSPLQMDMFGFGRHVCEVGSSRTVWLFWPLSQRNLERISQMEDRDYATVDQLAELEEGFWLYLAHNKNKTNMFFIPPYFAFMTIARAKYMYVSCRAFPADISSSRWTQWMATELDLLRKGHVLSPHTDAPTALAAFKSIIKTFAGSERAQIDYPSGLSGYLESVIEEVENVEKSFDSRLAVAQ
ncbi:hypothetical protein SCHPADRAFT_945318 [Schizopora paradoxa]|uniref:Uncharacterized protein n=1 Tax=Schizopora paradoxa TaxID=27342 RepID=A0A0H2R6D5_9AGAM|nr:hypothetical protein SCHPADRAFT_945318 [Schizopora paradoxa]